MKKTLCAILTASLLLASGVFAAPVSETVESAQEIIEATELLNGNAELSEETSELEAYYIAKYGFPVYFDDFENPAEGFKGGVGVGTKDTAGKYNNDALEIVTENGNKAVKLTRRDGNAGTHVYAYTKQIDATWNGNTGWQTEFPFAEGRTYTFVSSIKSVEQANNKWSCRFYYPYMKDGKITIGTTQTDTLPFNASGVSADEYKEYVISFTSGVAGNSNVRVGGEAPSADIYIDNVGLFGKPSAEYEGSVTLKENNIAFSTSTYTITVNLPTELDETYAAAIEKAPSALGGNIIAATVSGKVLTLTVNGSAAGSQTLEMPALIVSGGTQIIPACTLSYTAEKASKNNVLYGKKVYFDDFENPAEGFKGGVGVGTKDTAGKYNNDALEIVTENGNNAVKLTCRTGDTGTHVYAYTKQVDATWNRNTGWQTEFPFAAGRTYTFVSSIKSVEQADNNWSCRFYYPYMADGKIAIGTTQETTIPFAMSGISADKYKEYAISFTSDVTGNSNVRVGGVPPKADIYIDNVGLYEMPAATLKANVIDSDKTNRTVKLRYENGLWSSAAASVNAFGSELVDGAVLSYDETENVLTVEFNENTDTVTVPALIAADEENSYEAIEVCLLDRIATLNETDFKASVVGYSTSGIRFKGTVSNTLKSDENTTEYGFLVSLSSVLGENVLAFDTSKTNTPDKACTTADGVKFIYAMNYDTDSGINKYLDKTYNDGADTLFSAVLVNIKQEHYNDLFSVRAYVKAGNEYLYGDTVTQSIYETAKAKKYEYESEGIWDKLDDTTKNAIEEILTNAEQA